MNTIISRSEASEVVVECTMPEPLIEYAKKWDADPQEYAQEIVNQAAEKLEGPRNLN